MQSIKFEGANKNYVKPHGWVGECQALPTKIDEAGNITSVWEPSPMERHKIAAGQNITLTCAGVQPPVLLGVAPIYDALTVEYHRKLNRFDNLIIVAGVITAIVMIGAGFFYSAFRPGLALFFHLS